MKEKGNSEDKVKTHFKGHRLLTVMEVAELLHISRFSVHNLVKRGKLPAVKVMNRLRFDKPSIEQYLKNPKLIDRSPKVLRTIHLDKVQLERLDMLSAKTGVSKAVYIREALDLVLDKYENELKGKQ